MSNLHAALKTRAMLGLQSDRYTTDAEYRQAVDAGLALTKDEPKKAVRLLSVPNSRTNFQTFINTIKWVREWTGASLGDAKRIVESAPKVLLGNLSQSDADAFCKTLNDLGAKADVINYEA